MLIRDQHPHNRSIMAALLGAPNVGKSSLVNHLLGTDLTIVTPKPQTTRNRINCVLTVDRTEIVLVDTPGLHRSNQEINKRMNEEAINGSTGVDLNLLLVDLTADIPTQITNFRHHIEGVSLGPIWIIFTKADLVPGYESLPYESIMNVARELIPSLERYLVVSSKSGDNIHKLIGALCDVAPEAPHLYPGGEVSNKSERFFVSEYIREQAFHLLKEEVPYELAVVVDEFTDHREKDERPKAVVVEISATILVNRPSQRAIVVGSKGANIKTIGGKAREKIEAMIGGKVFLNLHVKVSPRWFKNNFVLEEIGLNRAKTSARVWRKKD